MNRDDIIRMAREAGASQLENTPGFIDYLQSFATLVAAAEREACLKIIRETPFSNWYAGDVDYAIRARGQQ